MAEPRECVRCGEVKKIVGRGLCSYCYQYLKRHNGLVEFLTRKESGPCVEIQQLDNGTPIKECTRCGEWKPLDAFYRSAQLKSGYESWCKQCRIEKGRQHYAPIKQEVHHRKRAQYQGNLKQCRLCKRYLPLIEYSKHPDHWDRLEHICKECHQFRTDPRYHSQDRLKGYQEWKKERQDRQQRNLLIWDISWRKRNPDKSRAIWHRYHARKLNATGDFTADQWKALKKHYSPSGHCLCCGKQKRLTQDHVIPLSKKGTNLIDNIQPLCQSCNSKKGNRLETDYRPDGGAFARRLLK